MIITGMTMVEIKTNIIIKTQLLPISP